MILTPVHRQLLSAALTHGAVRVTTGEQAKAMLELVFEGLCFESPLDKGFRITPAGEEAASNQREDVERAHG